MSEETIRKIRSELRLGMSLAKCRRCGCMRDTLEAMRSSLPQLPGPGVQPLVQEIDDWLEGMKPIRYACLGCEHCYAAVAANLLHRTRPELAASTSPNCGFEINPQTWPPVAGEYHAFCDGPGCPVAVSTLGSIDMAEVLASRRPAELCIAGKTETENIGIDKIIKNTITNPTIRYLVVAGEDPKGHQSGKTLLALMENGVDGNMRVIGSPGRRPVLRNVTRDEIEAFRKQVQVVDMVGCHDSDQVLDRVRSLPALTPPACGCREAEAVPHPSTAPVLRAEAPSGIKMDRAGYFVILPQPAKGTITVEHYSYDNRLQHVIEGEDARSIYSTLIKNGWVSRLSHAAYLGKELARAELSMKLGFKYIQDGA